MERMTFDNTRVGLEIPSITFPHNVYIKSKRSDCTTHWILNSIYNLLLNNNPLSWNALPSLKPSSDHFWNFGEKRVFSPKFSFRSILTNICAMTIIFCSGWSWYLQVSKSKFFTPVKVFYPIFAHYLADVYFQLSSALLHASNLTGRFHFFSIFVTGR